MHLRQLRTFVLAADAGGLAAAAGRLNLSQPAASRQIQALEAELGVPLFDRIGRRLHLTSEGEDLLRRCRRLLQDAEAIGERARSLKGGQTGVLRVGASPQVIEATLAPFLKGYRRRHPGIEVPLVATGGVTLSEQLGRGDLQLALLVRVLSGLESRPLHWVWALAVVPEDHPLAGERVCEVSRLTDEPLLILDRTFASREWFDAACTLAQARPNVLLESSAPHTMVALAAAGYGIAIIPTTVEFAREGVRALPLMQRGAPLGRWMTVAWDAQRSLSPFAVQFVDELAAYCQRNYPGREFAKVAPFMRAPRRGKT